MEISQGKLWGFYEYDIISIFLILASILERISLVLTQGNEGRRDRGREAGEVNISLVPRMRKAAIVRLQKVRCQVRRFVIGTELLVMRQV